MAAEVEYWIYIYLLFWLLSFSIVTINYFTAPRFKLKKTSDQNKKVSILIPCRNEETNVTKTVLSCLNLNYQNIEILVLNDKSTDKTGEVLNNLASKYPEKVKVFEGTELPDDWLGKNWACWNLQKYATGDYLLFIDADVVLHKYALDIALEELEKNKFDMVSAFSSQKMQTFGEFLIVPLMEWFLTAFLPLISIYKLSHHSLAAANGQFILIRKNVYDKVGGHETLKYQVVEDLEMSRLLKREKYKVCTYFANDFVMCRMYKSFEESFLGFTKNYYLISRANPVLFILFHFAVVMFYVVIPVYLLFYSPYLGFVALSFLIVGITMKARMTNQGVMYSILLFPLHMIMTIPLSIRSYYAFLTKTGVWKGRQLKIAR